jgi:hypothetical protein
MRKNDIQEEFTNSFKPTCSTGTFIKKAAKYLGKSLNENWSKHDIRKLYVKVNKMKRSEVKAERQKVHSLIKQL